ncbi:MAG: hypothetical protein EHM60_01855 [Lysobacterales bacterium]|jgi:hypothetical protein|nr:MAG: hypothetical protein EHM60_01855 [Xanthomonadales bacterium]
MKRTSRWWLRWAFVGGLATAFAGGAPAGPAQSPPAAVEPVSVTVVEAAYVDWLDARDATSALGAGALQRRAGLDLAAWETLARERRARLVDLLHRLPAVVAPDADARAVAAMRRSLELYDAGTVPTAPVRASDCSDAQRPDSDEATLRASLEACFVELGGSMQFEGRTIDRGMALQRLHLLDDPARRRALFAAFGPLWNAVHGDGTDQSPYRRLIRLTAANAAERGGTPVDEAARALGVEVADVERWLVEVLEAWRDASGPATVEPWDYRYVHGAAHRRLEPHVPQAALLPVSERYFRDLGADPRALGVVYDVEPRPGKAPAAYADFLQRGRPTGHGWQPSTALVVANYPEGGLFALNELVHELGHAVHVSAIRTRPAWLDWPDTLLTEAFADVPSWSNFEPAWQQRYLGAAAGERESLRALYSGVMLDVAWGLFELRLLRDPASDPSAVWTDITSRYLHVRPHPELPWWAMRVQLVTDPGYMVNYALGAMLTAEMRAAAAQAVGPFETGAAGWYHWASERLLRYGAERDTRELMRDLLGRPPSPDALVAQIRRIGAPGAVAQCGRECDARPESGRN